MGALYRFHGISSLNSYRWPSKFGKPDASGSRKSHAMLTGAGRQLLETIRPFVHQGEDRVFAGIDQRRFTRERDAILTNVEAILESVQAKDTERE